MYKLKKFVGMGFTRRRERGDRTNDRSRPAKRPRVEINGTVVKMEPAHKFLGVILDQELWFKEHAAYAHGKGMAVAMQTWRLAKVNGGIKGPLAKQVYDAVVAPNMLYAADVWCTPDVEVGGKVVKGARGFMKMMARVQ